MEPLKWQLVIIIVLGLAQTSSQQRIENNAPDFLTLDRNGVDGNLLNTLATVGLLENMPVDTVVGSLSCTDKDDDQTITYYVESNTVRVDKNTGEVRLSRALDRELYKRNSNSTDLRTTFKCRDSLGLETKTTIIISVLDVNDNPPTFKNLPYRTDIPENTIVGSTFYQSISITDEDGADNARIQVSCYAPPDDAEKVLVCRYFSVITFQITDGDYRSSLILNEPLDYESKKSFTMTLFAEDEANGDINNPKLNKTVNILIDVVDNQDTPPIFLNVPLTLYVEENSDIDSVTGLIITAKDGDEGTPRPIKIVELEDPRNLFYLGDTYRVPNTDNYAVRVYVGGNIDRETLQGSYQFTVQAIEMINNGTTETNDRATADVRVDILDINDNIPQFSQTEYDVELFEIDNDQSSFQVPDLNIQITDRDNPSNARYRVVIASQSQQTFRVFPSTEVVGNVAVNLETINTGLLDYDIPAYRFQTVILEAREVNKNGVNKTSTATVNIILKDLNDNSPIFSQDQYFFEQPENAPVGTPIGAVTATDLDEGLNGQITYSLSRIGSNQFSINSATGEITLAQPLDYETNRVFQILVEASDNATPPRRTSKTLTLNVLNVNDEGPRPVRNLYQTFARETNRTLRPAVIVQATDTEGPTSNITYEIIEGNRAPDIPFKVDSVSGEFTLTQNLDYDAAPNNNGIFTVVIQASDNGNPPQYANITVRVTVQDENNNEPIFERFNYFANISELAPEGDRVVTVSATDQDGSTNGEIRYSIQSGGREHFQINENSGIITVSSKAKLNHTRFPEYNMIVYATDKGSPPKTGTATVLVEISDANNELPVFTQQIYVLSVPGDTPIGTSVLKVSANDRDTSNSLRYFIPLNTVTVRNSGGKEIFEQTSFDFKNAFVVDPNTGVISTNRTLDRDKAAELNFNVVVEDQNAHPSTGRQTASTSVLITVLGTDISTIYFTPAFYSFTVTEGKTAGYLITTVAARDPACGKCLIKNYVEVPNTDQLGYLQVERDTGRVTLSKTINYEVAESRQLYMEIEARSDDGRTARTNVRVEVKDDNDNSPIFRQDTYEFTVSETAIYPYRVGYVKAEDKDSGSFGRVVYSLSGQGATDFLIFSSGVILVNLSATLDFEKKTVYNLLVTASDNPTNVTSTVRLQTSVPLQINIRDENDNKPEFGSISPFYVVENVRVGSNVGRVVATDKDAGTNGEVFFSMDDTSKNFRITNSGYILTSRNLTDMSPQSPFLVTVRAQDRGSPSLYRETEVTIIVRSGQLDDGRPQWSIPRLGQSYYVVENTPDVQFVVQARAQAKSAGPEVTYRFSTESEDYQMFNIDPVTGNVTTNGIFDWETKNVYSLILIATDVHNDTLQSLRGLTVRVRDVNDNVPDFGNCPGISLEVPQRVTIPEDTAVNSTVYQVKACDLDEVINGVIYSEETGNDMCTQEMADEYFKVDINGLITLHKPLDREVKQYHLVCVRASPERSNRRRRQADGFDRLQMTEENHVAYVVIQISDRNDNGPVFLYPNKRLFEAVETVPSEKAVRRVLAVDPDLPPFNRVRYSIKDIIYNEPDYPSYPLPGSFLIGSDTGIVSVNFPSYSDFRIPYSYFNITIQAEDFRDPSMLDRMNLYVYIFEPSQTVRVVINKSPDEAKPDVDTMISRLAEADPNSLFKLQQISYHRVVDDFDVTRTDVCFVVVKNDKVLSVREGGDTLTQAKVEDILRQYGATSPGSCYRSRSSLDKIDWAPLWWTLVALAIFIFICCVILIVVVYILHRNYKNYMRTRKTYLVPQ